MKKTNGLGGSIKAEGHVGKYRASVELTKNTGQRPVRKVNVSAGKKTLVCLSFKDGGLVRKP